MMFFDPTYMIFMLPAILFTVAAQFYVNSAYRKWSQVAVYSRMTGADAAERLIRMAGLMNVRIQPIAGNLTDHYDPRTKVLGLSQGVYRGNSIASLAIAAHELGHAQQDQENYFPLRVRAALIPAVNIGSWLGWILIILGLVLGLTNLAWVGVMVFSAGALFALATLPVELNASARARQLLSDAGLIYSEEEQKGVKTVLNAAALTYVAALATAIFQLLYYITLVGGIGGDRD